MAGNSWSQLVEFVWYLPDMQTPVERRLSSREKQEKCNASQHVHYNYVPYIVGRKKKANPLNENENSSENEESKGKNKYCY